MDEFFVISYCDLNQSPPPQPFYGPFSGTTRVSRCQKRTSELLDFMVQGKINRGRHTDHPVELINQLTMVDDSKISLTAHLYASFIVFFSDKHESTHLIQNLLCYHQCTITVPVLA